MTHSKSRKATLSRTGLRRMPVRPFHSLTMARPGAGTLDRRVEDEDAGEGRSSTDLRERQQRKAQANEARAHLVTSWPGTK